IFQLVQREFERAGYGGGRLPAGVVLTGGTAHLPGMVELARDAFAVPVRAGSAERGISGLVDSVQARRYAVPLGRAREAAAKAAGTRSTAWSTRGCRASSSSPSTPARRPCSTTRPT